MFDILVIGGGPSGLTAALYGARAGHSVLVMEQSTFGGQISMAHQIDNYPALADISGIDLSTRLLSQARAAGIRDRLSQVQHLSVNHSGDFTAATDTGAVHAKTVIFAAGAKARKLSVPGEDRFLGRGVSYCALCDGSFFRGQEVAVIGGGNTALGDAWYLSKVCRKVTIVHRRTEFRADPSMFRMIQKADNIQVCIPWTVQSLTGKSHLEQIHLQHELTLQKVSLDVSGVFAALGRVPDTKLVSHLVPCDTQGYILAGENCETKIPGLYAAGDCRQKVVHQLTTATADGTVAAIAACHYLQQYEHRRPEKR